MLYYLFDEREGMPTVRVNDITILVERFDNVGIAVRDIHTRELAWVETARDESMNDF
jgi:hypothetical protein